MRILLRGQDSWDADFPVYSLTDHFFAMNDGTDGKVSMFGGSYTAAVNGDTFESTYTRIEGVQKRELSSNQGDESDNEVKENPDSALKITVKKDQPVWPEWTGEKTASDIEGREYFLKDGKWLSNEEAKTAA